MTIILMRHGKPKLPNIKVVTGFGFSKWIRIYNRASICSSSIPSYNSLKAVESNHFVVCSNLTRSIESAKILGLDINEISEIYREFEIPSGLFAQLSLPIAVWAIFYRVIWLLGFSKNSESYKLAKYRAKDVANKLILTSEREGAVIFVGHALLNRFIARELLNRYWVGPKDPGKRYWQYGIYKPG